ncbi:hypothetical protein MAR_48A [Vibrio phage vB_VpaM_MAR]|uniref:Uncharacterized protein n=1 Tax=Vibrio phage vB_VpaM_MAR TaxID=1229754 RepID=K7RFZ6_9CAUD|nr:hypothetical protein F861_gp48 [Vibrio phage vB_VpaM_MAR]AFV81387.1 hypothetical protein MAR_48A [Vibrio phage vB_VpaM_MAR]
MQIGSFVQVDSGLFVGWCGYVRRVVGGDVLVDFITGCRVFLSPEQLTVVSLDN